MENNVRSIRTSKGMTLNKLVELTGVSRTRLYLIENGKAGGIRIATMKKISEALEEPAANVFPDFF